jgi:hypothetical protein
VQDLPIILGTLAVVLGGGVFIFFYWRKTYGVWARSKPSTRNVRQAGDGGQTVVMWDGPGATGVTAGLHGSSDLTPSHATPSGEVGGHAGHGGASGGWEASDSGGSAGDGGGGDGGGGGGGGGD